MNDKKLMSAAGLNEVREWLRSNYHVPHQVVANMLAHIAALEEQLAAVNECSVAHERVLQHEIDELKRNYDHWRNIATLAQRDTAERVAAVIERTLEILHADDYDDGEYTHQFSSWAHLEIAIRALAPNAEQILAQRDVRVRLEEHKLACEDCGPTQPCPRRRELAVASGEVSK